MVWQSLLERDFQRRPTGPAAEHLPDPRACLQGGDSGVDGIDGVGCSVEDGQPEPRRRYKALARAWAGSVQVRPRLNAVKQPCPKPCPRPDDPASLGTAASVPVLDSLWQALISGRGIRPHLGSLLG